MLVDSNLQGPVRVTLTWLLIYNVPIYFALQIKQSLLCLNIATASFFSLV